MSGSVYNVEVYRCTACNGEVAVAPVGFTIDEDDLNSKLQDHLKTCEPEGADTDARR